MAAPSRWTHVLILALSSLIVCTASAATGIQKIAVQVSHRASRVPILTQEIDFPSEGKPVTLALKGDSSLNGLKLKVTVRPVRVNSETDFSWVEANLQNKKGNDIAYLVATVADKRFSVGTSFRDPAQPGNELVLMLDTTSLKK